MRTGGRLPFLFGEVKQNPLQFQRYSFFANKTFQDSKNFERVNAMFGVSLLRDQRFFGIDAEQRSRGWGYFVELDTIPIVNHLSLFARYNQLRPTTLATDKTLQVERSACSSTRSNMGVCRSSTNGWSTDKLPTGSASAGS